MEQQASQPDFWDDPAASQKVMKELTELRALVASWQTLAQRGRDAAELIELGDESMAADLTAEVEIIQHDLDRREFDLMLSGPHDHGNALIALHAGAGGVDAAD
ncbi:MAG: PCRF domain-containing protein, partial [Chloroflexi bacterium]|nr:PCRF domain-containing protein [Chloroflexota bacterium]